MRREDATLRAQEQPARPGRVGPSGRVARAPSRCIRTGSPSGVHGARGAARIRPTSSRSTTRPSARGAGCRLTSRLPIAPLPAAKASTCGSRPRRTCAGASREVSLVRHPARVVPGVRQARLYAGRLNRASKVHAQRHFVSTAATVWSKCLAAQCRALYLNRASESISQSMSSSSLGRTSAAP